MEIVSELVDLPNIGEFSTEYIENELTKRNINALRWAIVNVRDKIFTVSLAKLK